MITTTAFTRKVSLALFLLAATANAQGNEAPLRVLQTTDSLKEVMDQTAAAKQQAHQNALVEDHEKTDLLSPSVLEQIHVITRHGSRSMMSKDANSLAEEGQATLTPLGQQQLYKLGQWLRESYKDRLGHGKSLEHYNPSLHRFESTNLDRTLSSANSLSMGLFPSKTRATGIHNIDPDDPKYDESMLYTSLLEQAPSIPIYTGGKDYNDVTLRSFRNCPTFMNRLINGLYTSPEWIGLEGVHTGLLEKLGRIFPEFAVDGKIPLQSIWNVYDPMHVARTECTKTEDDSCSAFVTHETLASAISDAEFDQLEQIMEYVEYLKFGRGLDATDMSGIMTAGNLLGSNLLWKILNRAKGDGDFFLYSAHAPTLIGFLSTLQAAEDFYTASQGERFVDYGSALIVEIHKSKDKGKYFFVLKYKSSEKENAVNVVLKESTTGIKCGQDDFPNLPNIPKASWCALDEVLIWAGIYTLTSEKEWCKACNNKLADVCVTGMSAFDEYSSSSSSMTITNYDDDDVSASGTSSGVGKSRTEHKQVDDWLASSEFMGFDDSANATTMICLLFFGGFSAGVILMGLVWFSTSCCNKTKNDRKTAGDDTSPSSPTVTVVDNDKIHGNEVAGSDETEEKLNGKEIC
eukprot:CAMPEP_0168219830 /NCGR_PEP_ID=MMETSP0140_2-20121125/8839_1 /TAXON_ID=44445 /ORGANISM="Pseudo-nitzschia australis, Strain 10249 10 AB" /LENGTH=631 /DNA_ID=CAMNT_0008148377 /DNA_START=154 /DNA_END=2049 /DNA_ORIENTATION=+